MMNGPFLIQVVFILVLLGLAGCGHWLLGVFLRRFRRWAELHLHPSERLWTEIIGVLLLLLLRSGLWLLAIATIFTQVALLQPISQTLNLGLSDFSAQVGTWLTGPKIDLGKTRLSLSMVMTAILTAIAIFIGARLLSKSIKTWVLGQSRMDRGMQEAISTLITYAIATLGIALIEAGGFFGEISLFTGMPRSTTVQAHSDVTLFVVDHRALKILLQNHQELAEEIAQSLAQRQQLLRELGILSADLSQNETETPLWWIRQRIHNLFGL